MEEETEDKKQKNNQNCNTLICIYKEQEKLGMRFGTNIPIFILFIYFKYLQRNVCASNIGKQEMCKNIEIACNGESNFGIAHFLFSYLWNNNILILKMRLKKKRHVNY